MNCSKCSTPIDYRFSTVCPHCETEVPAPEPVRDVKPLAVLAPKHHKRTFLKYFENTVLVLMCAFASTIIGATAMYVLGGLLYRAVVTPGTHSCGEGNAIAYLVILTGGFLGCAGGTAFGYRNTMRRVASG